MKSYKLFLLSCFCILLCVCTTESFAQNYHLKRTTKTKVSAKKPATKRGAKKSSTIVKTSKVTKKSTRPNSTATLKIKTKTPSSAFLKTHSGGTSDTLFQPAPQDPNEPEPKKDEDEDDNQDDD